ncbi:helix-turn-helix domain-containing protein [Agathobaculum desmolans]|uniref:helix-turn-helix domain-containing protein n=1 Tax=Agathobaculum desmolans TaxID=39484 RepID=UPI0004E1CB03|nr:helix-turn-helix transcriptional regulator [Agathobaculum desmolans]
MKIYNYNGRANICGTQIRILRKQKKLSQEELAARLQVAGVDLDQKAISRIECEKRFLADFELREIARILQISMDELAGR